MDIITTPAENCVVLSLVGRMDATSTGEFDARATSVLSSGALRVLLDMAELVYISSAGLRSLLGLAKNLKAQKGLLAFCSLQPMVAEVFRISGFDRMLSVYADRETGMKALAGQG